MKTFDPNKEPKIKSGFKAPEGYFADFTDRLMQQLPEEKEVKVVPLYRRKPIWISSVAAILILALALSVYFRMDTARVQDYAAPGDDAIESYLLSQQNFNAYDISQSLDDKDIQDLEQTVALSNDDIESYLSTQDYDIYLNE